jgi:hypothetical protein
MINKGTFRARAVQGSAALGLTGKGTEQIAVQFEILEGENEGNHITWYGYFSDAALDRTLESLRYCGWQGDALMDLSTIGDADAPEVSIVIEHEPDLTGELRAKVRWVNKLSTGVALKERMTDIQARAFSERMKGKVIAKRQAAPKTSNGNGQRPPPRNDDGDPGFGDDDFTL